MSRWLPLAVLVFCRASAHADDAKQFFDSLYGNRIKQVKATADRADDLALAKEILAAAQSIERTDAVSLMCDSVVDLAQRHTDGLAIAIDATRSLGDKVETRRAESRKKLIELLTRQSTTGDAKAKQKAGEDLIALLVQLADESAKAGNNEEALASYRQALAAAQRQKSPEADAIKAKMELAGHRARIEKHIARLREKLLENANDPAPADEIVKLYAIDLDNPAEAMKYIERANDAKLTKLVPLAAKSIDSVDEVGSLALGEWYAELVNGAPAAMKEAMWRRASAYLTRYLGLSPTDELARAKAELLLKPVAASLAAIESERAKIQLSKEAEKLGNWISSNATYKASSQNAHHPPLADLLTGGKNLHLGQFAFHTAENTAGQYIVIDLGKSKTISRIWIENRRHADANYRAKGMTMMFTSKSNEKAKPLWTAERAEKDWTIELPEKTKARYITIKQEDTNSEPLHLAQVKVFGWDE